MSPASLHPQTQTNLHVAILTIAKIHGLGEMPESVVGYLMDQMRDSLSPEQRREPLSVYTPQVLGMVEARIGETYGLDRPANIHAGPQDPGKRDGLDETTSFFALDAFGLTRQQRQFGGISNEEHSLRTMLPVGAYRTSYADIDPRVWNPASGAAGLTPLNFGTTDFARSGLDLPTTQYLFGQGFTSNQIIHAGQDAQALGLNPRDRQTARDFAVLDRFDPDGRAQRNTAYSAYDKWLKDHRDQITQLQAAVADAPDEDARTRAKANLAQFLQAGKDDTGISAVGQRIATEPPAPGAEPGDRPNAMAGHNRITRQIEQVNEVSAELVQELGATPETGNIATETLVDAEAQAGVARPAESIRRAVASTADSSPPTEADQIDDFGVVAEPAAAVAPTATAALTGTPTTEKKEVVVGSTTEENPGKEKDDQVIVEPDRPATAVASTAVKPPAPTVS